MNHNTPPITHANHVTALLLADTSAGDLNLSAYKQTQLHVYFN